MNEMHIDPNKVEFNNLTKEEKYERIMQIAKFISQKTKVYLDKKYAIGYDFNGCSSKHVRVEHYDLCYISFKFISLREDQSKGYISNLRLYIREDNTWKWII